MTVDRTYVRDVAAATVELGWARVECGDLDHSVATVEQAADLVVQNRSVRLAGEINARPHPHATAAASSCRTSSRSTFS